MTEEAHFGDLDEAMAALKRDLLSEEGPRISTMRNYRFAILPYLPNEEFKLRHHMLRLTEELRAEGWACCPFRCRSSSSSASGAPDRTTWNASSPRETAPLRTKPRSRPGRCQRDHRPPHGRARRHRCRRGQADRRLRRPRTLACATVRWSSSAAPARSIPSFAPRRCSSTSTARPRTSRSSCSTRASASAKAVSRSCASLTRTMTIARAFILKPEANHEDS